MTRHRQDCLVVSGGRRELGITLRVAMRMRAKVKCLLPNIWTPRGRRVWMSTVLNSAWRQSRGNMSATVCLQHCARYATHPPTPMYTVHTRLMRQRWDICTPRTYTCPGQSKITIAYICSAKTLPFMSNLSRNVTAEPRATGAL